MDTNKLWFSWDSLAGTWLANGRQPREEDNFEIDIRTKEINGQMKLQHNNFLRQKKVVKDYQINMQ